MEEDTESFAAVVLDELSSGTDVDMPRLIVDVLSTTAEPAGCWFHHKKATPPSRFSYK